MTIKNVTWTPYVIDIEFESFDGEGSVHFAGTTDTLAKKLGFPSMNFNDVHTTTAAEIGAKGAAVSFVTPREPRRKKRVRR